MEILVTGDSGAGLKDTLQEADRLLALGKPKEAYGLYVLAVRMSPQDSQIWYRLALAAGKAGSPEKAQEALDRMQANLGDAK